MGGQGFPCSTQANISDFNRSGAMWSMSWRLHLSRPVAAVGFLGSMRFRSWSGVTGSYGMLSWTGMAVSTNCSIGSQKLSGVSRCLTQRAVHSCPKRANRVVRSPTYVSWVTGAPFNPYCVCGELVAWVPAGRGRADLPQTWPHLQR